MHDAIKILTNIYKGEFHEMIPMCIIYHDTICIMFRAGRGQLKKIDQLNSNSIMELMRELELKDLERNELKLK